MTHLLAVAPMLRYTDRHCRYFLRLLTKRTLLYTEMLVASGVLRGDHHRLLAYDPSEHPIALQLGGSEPQVLAECAKIAVDYGYDEINLNIGCPSTRVQEGRFGACLMREPDLVAECVAAMHAAVKIPITVKTRIGVDDHDSYAALKYFIEQIVAAGCNSVIMHARKAWLKGLSPRENRNVPPLNYEMVYQLKKDFPHLPTIINGGIKTLTAAQEQLQFVDGVMMGREIYANPYLLATADHLLYQTNTPIPSRLEVLQQYMLYAERQIAMGVPLSSLLRHILGLFHGVTGARNWRRYLSENTHKSVGIAVLQDAMQYLEESVAIPNIQADDSKSITSFI